MSSEQNSPPSPSDVAIVDSLSINTGSALDITGGKQLFTGVGDELQPVDGVDYLDIRQKLVDSYRRKRGTLLARVASSTGDNSVDSIITSVIAELAQETENLLGNEIMMMTAGQVDKASVVSVKRADVLDVLSKVAIRRKEAASSSAIDLNSPVFQMFQQLCFEKLTEAMGEMTFTPEERQLLVSKWMSKMNNWVKELRERLANL